MRSIIQRIIDLQDNDRNRRLKARMLETAEITEHKESNGFFLEIAYKGETEVRTLREILSLGV